MNRLYIQDRVSYKTTQREMTPEGFLKVPGRVAKTGTQEYLRRELGLDGNPNEVVVVYRPPEEVFSEDSLASYDGIDLTILHPKELVNSKNYKETSVGSVRGKGRKDGDFVVVDMIFKDEAAIAKIMKDGFVEQSGGYTAEYFADAGTDPETGIAYQYVQRGIVMNHVASLPLNTARAGRKARLFDHDPQPKGNTMTTVTLDSGHKVDLQDEAVALLVTESITRLKTTADEAKAALKDAKDDSDRKQAKIDAMEEEAEKKKGETSDAVISERLKQISEVKDKAVVIKSEFTSDSLDPVVIMRGVLAVSRPTVDWKEKSDEYVRASFDLAHEQAKAGPGNEEQRRQIAQDASKGVQQIEDASLTAYDKYKADFTKTAEAK